MKRDTINFILNVISFVVLAGLALSGIIIALPHEHGPNEGMARGQWGDAHLWMGIIFVTFILVKFNFALELDKT